MTRQHDRWCEFQGRFRARARIGAFLLGVAVLAGCVESDPAPPAAPDVAAPAAPDLSGRWLARVQREIAAREYEASESGNSLQAPNRQQGLRTWFEPTGVRVVDRMADDAALAELSLASIGRNGNAQPVVAGEVTHEGARVEIRRPGLVEWYDNSPAGLEQGFTLQERPPGDGPVVFALAVGAANARLRGDSVALRAASGRKLAYGAIVATDATGRALAAHFEVPRSDRIELVVDDCEATYPLMIDPLLTATADAQLESNQAVSEFGTSVASAGDVNGDGYADVIVGANFYDSGQTDEGAAFVFLGSATGIADGSPSTALAQLESNQAHSDFGRSVAGAGDVNGDGYDDVIVGARLYDAGQGGGAAFIFLGSATGIADGSPATAHAQLESDQAGASFGWSVAGAGDVNGDGYADVIVGAITYEFDQTILNRGAAFLFLGSALGIADGNPGTADGQLDGLQSGSQFGWSVASAGDVNGDGYSDVIVGASQYNRPDSGEGAAFVFLGSASGIPYGDPLTASATLESNQAGAGLGTSVAGAGDVNGDGYADVIVGAPGYDAPDPDEGAAFVFLGGPSGIADGSPTTAHAQLESNQGLANMGYSVAGAGDVNGDGYADVIVGAREYYTAPGEGGAAFVFLGSASGIADGNPATAAAVLESPNSQYSILGTSVAAAGDVNGDGYADVIVGAPSYDAGEFDEGAAFVYLGGASGIEESDPTTVHAEIQSNQAGGELGISVAGAGDVNGDGYADVILGASYYDLGEVNEGVAFVFLGGPAAIGDGNPITASTLLQSNQTAAYFGTSVAGAGDVNGDGYGDVIIGASYYDAGETNEGAAFVYLGSATGIADGDPSTADAQIESDQTNGFLGNSVAGAGDVNGDGYADVIVGAQVYDDGETDEGAAFVFDGSATGIPDASPATADARLESNQASAYLGWSVAGAGDVNGDGYADVIVGAIQYADGETGEGAAFVFLGSASGIADGSPATADTRLESNQANAHFGWSVAGIGDVTGNGHADVIVGAPHYEFDQTAVDEGAAFVFFGGVLGIPDNDAGHADVQFKSRLAGAQFGASVAGAGDVDGDGVPDVIIGSPAFIGGAAFVFLGSTLRNTTGTPSASSAYLLSDQASARLGASVAGAGDVNGDGVADVIVGAPLYADPQTQEGAAFLLLGNGLGRPDPARQRRGDGSGVPVAAWGGTPSNDGFVVELPAHDLHGSGRVKLESEACPSGVAFGDSACTVQTSPSWLAVDGTSPTITLSEAFTGLTPDTLYRWRTRVLHAPFGVAQPSITPPPNPPHGPWRRLDAQASQADIRLVPEPHALSMIVAGATLLAGLERRRRKPSP
jgi:hypothetical protein